MGGKSILIIEDEKAIADLLAMVLEEEGYHVRVAANGHESLSRIAERQPDLILSDLMMPRLDGWELHERLQADPQLSKIPLLLMSAVNPTSSVNQPGISGFLLKPFDLDQLLDMVQRLING